MKLAIWGEDELSEMSMIDQGSGFESWLDNYHTYKAINVHQQAFSKWLKQYQDDTVRCSPIRILVFW